MVAAGPSVVGASLVFADGSGDPAAVKNEDGKYSDKEGNPTFKVQSDGTVDWLRVEAKTLDTPARPTPSAFADRRKSSSRSR